MTAIDEAKRRAEISADIFSDRLRYFVQRWKPEDPQDLYDFQMSLTRLMVDAMRHKSDMLGYGLTVHVEAQYAEMALRPIRVVMEEPK